MGKTLIQPKQQGGIHSQDIETREITNQYMSDHIQNPQDNAFRNTSTELQRTYPGTKVTGEFSTRGHIFPPNV